MFCLSSGVYWCEFSPSKRSPARTASLPPRPSRPLVLRRELAQPAQEAAETYSVAGVNYTTYTTFRSPITPDQCDSVSSKQFPSEGEGGGETPTTPTNTPHIPEPDYDLRYSTSEQHGSVLIALHCVQRRGEGELQRVGVQLAGGGGGHAQEEPEAREEEEEDSELHNE